jgi:hemerythrin
MAFFEWHDRYNVGVPEIDAQHRGLVEMINRLDEGMQREQGAGTTGAALDEMTTLAAVLNELIAYTTYHFSTEENLMDRYGYPEYPSHRAAHSELTNIVRTFQREFDEGKAVSCADLAAVLQAWLKDHIFHADVKLGHFLREKASMEHGGAPRE